jgi:hypothetical protein
MSENIYQFNGSLLVSVADGALNTTAAPIAFPGRGYTNYGSPVLQNQLWDMQHFAGTVAPTPLLQGVVWYNTNGNQLQVYTGTVWSTLFKDNQNNLPAVTLTYDLGSNSLKFNNIWAGTVNANTINVSGTITGPTNIFYTTQTNLPALTNTYNLGSSSFLFNTVYATTFNGTATQAQYADVAERYEADQEMEVGDVVSIGGAAEITKTTVDCDAFVFGVISDKPALQMNSNAGTDDTHPYVALIGRTPCKVIGPVGKGCRLVSSDTPGVARAADSGENPLCVIGRALADKTSAEIGLVEIVIGRA